MKKLVTLTAAAALATAFLLGGAPSALADDNDTFCPPALLDLVPTMVDNLIITGMCVIPAGGTVVKGNVKVVGGGNLIAGDSVAGFLTVGGSLQVDGGTLLYSSVGAFDTVGDTLQCKNAISCIVSGVTIGGDLEAIEGGPVIFALNTVGGNLKAEKNLGGVGVIANLITGNLECKENVPPAVGGAPSNIADQKKDECFGL